MRRTNTTWSSNFSLPAEIVHDLSASKAAVVRGDSLFITLREGVSELVGAVHGDSLAATLVNGSRRTPVTLGRAGSPLATCLAELVSAAAAANRPPLQLAHRGPGVVDSNKAVNLIAGIVERASGRKLDDFLREELFAPLGITDFTLTRDAAGNPHAMSAPQAHSEDLATLGQLVVQRGEWKGERLIDAASLNQSVRTDGFQDSDAHIRALPP